jgi:diguanylate cyclase (GGDEF)-like protein
MPAHAERFTDLVRLTPGACMLTAAGVVAAVNDEVAAVTAIPADKLLGAHLGDFLLPELEPAWQRTQEQAVGASTLAHSRLSATLAPVELTVRRLDALHLAVAIRSTAAEHHYSALARAELTHDPVTGLANRHHLLWLLHQRVTAVGRAPLALVALWIDELSTVAANRGERAADRVLREVGQRLQTRLRSPDVLGRFDQSGYLGLLGSEAPPAQLAEIGERMRAEVAFPVEVENGLVSFTASVVVASIKAPQISIQRVLSQLEAAATRAGRSGNRTEVLDL